jgi:hypothetical protein
VRPACAVDADMAISEGNVSHRVMTDWEDLAPLLAKLEGSRD